MGYIKEPKGIDFMVESKEWSAREIEEMRQIINKSKAQKAKRATIFLRNSHKETA